MKLPVEKQAVFVILEPIRATFDVSKTRQKEDKMSPMVFNQYSVRVSPGQEIEDGYVLMKHGDVYTLNLRNFREVRCAANVIIDGRDVGTWLINAYGSITLERPVNDEGRFTFYQSGTNEFSKVGGDAVSVNDRGLIRVIFTPEKVQPVAQPVVKSYYVAASVPKEDSGNPKFSWANSNTFTTNVDSYSGQRGTSAGVTGLSGHSDQKFYTVDGFEHDYSRQITINLRLVAKRDEPRPLVSVSNPVPPPVP